MYNIPEVHMYTDNKLDNRPSVFDESTVRDQSSDEEDPAQAATKTMSSQLRCCM